MGSSALLGDLWPGGPHQRSGSLGPSSTAASWGLCFSPAVWDQHQLLQQSRGLCSDFMPFMTQQVVSLGATNASHYAMLPDALLLAGIWPACDKEALHGERSEAALLSLSWILVYPVPSSNKLLTVTRDPARPQQGR